MAGNFIPTHTRSGDLVPGMNSRMYASQFSRSGNLLVVASQDHKIAVLDSTTDAMKPIKEIVAEDIQWTITSVDATGDDRFVLYTTINPRMHLCNVGGEYEMDEVLELKAIRDDPQSDRRMHRRREFGTWCAKLSAGGREVVAGCSNDCVMVYDVERRETVAQQTAHTDDINAVTFLDLDRSPHLVASGSDDTLIKVFDRRIMGQSSKAQGVLPGHGNGITSLSSKGDGRYLISNSKDNTCKVWDVRRMFSSESFAALPQVDSPFEYDYRWGNYPGWGRPWHHPHDRSILTLRGHVVSETLIRCYYSPVATTGQKYIYSGSADGKVHVWDAMTGEVACRLSSGSSTVRDVSWHPTRPLLVTAAFDGCVRLFDAREQAPMGHTVTSYRRRYPGDGDDDDDDDDGEDSVGGAAAARRRARRALRSRTHRPASSSDEGDGDGDTDGADSSVTEDTRPSVRGSGIGGSVQFGNSRLSRVQRTKSSWRHHDPRDREWKHVEPAEPRSEGGGEGDGDDDTGALMGGMGGGGGGGSGAGPFGG